MLSARQLMSFDRFGWYLDVRHGNEMDNMTLLRRLQIDRFAEEEYHKSPHTSNKFGKDEP